MRISGTWGNLLNSSEIQFYHLKSYRLLSAAAAFLCAASIFVSGSVIADEVKPLAPRILVIGGLLNEPEDVAKILHPMARYVKAKMADLGVVDVLVVAAYDREYMSQLVRHGRVDWVSQTAFNVNYFREHSEMDVLARSWRGGSPTYKSVFFVRKDSDLQTLDDLMNRTIAFEHRYSTSAYFVPKAELESSGNATYLMTSHENKVPPRNIGYLFSNSEYNTAMWVHKGVVDAGVIGNMYWNDSAIVPLGFRDEFRVLHETDDFVRALELVRSDLDGDIKQRLSEILANMHEDPEATDVLKAYFDTQKFDAPTADDLERLNSFSSVLVPSPTPTPTLKEQ